MKIGFPVANEGGLESRIFGHFGSTPLFMVVDGDTEACSYVPNRDPLAPEAGCNVLKALINSALDAMIVDGIGDGFLQILNDLNIKVYQALSPEIGKNLEQLREGQLPAVEMLDSAKAGRCVSDDGTPHTCNHSHDEEE